MWWVGATGFDALRDQARDIKDHVLDHLDIYLERYEAKVKESGGHVHWAEDADQARAAILAICRKANARLVTKGKSMISEEIDLNKHLEENGITPVETDLGEYIIQLRHERPSHIIAPAVHLTRDQVEADFRKAHTHLDPKRDLTEIPALVEEAVTVGDLVRLFTFRQGDANLVEITLSSDSPVVGQRVGDQRWPSDTALVAIVRGPRVFAPSRLFPSRRLIITTLAQGSHKPT